MPGRKISLVTGGIYHIYNRGIASQPTFFNQREYQRALDTISYYQSRYTPIKFSRLISLTVDERQSLLINLRKKQDFFVEIIAYCLMPNHFHFLLKQTVDNGISKFMSNIINSYTRYFNTKRDRTGQLFSGKFKSIQVESDEQLLHVSRYIHLNPHTAFLTSSLKELETYPYSSFKEYINPTKSNLSNGEIILSNFKDKDSYKQFVVDQTDYQRMLDYIKHLTFE